MELQKFYWDDDNDIFFLVSFQERKYFEIGKDSPFYKLCRHLYCGRWNFVKTDIENNYRKVDRIEQIDGTEDW